MAWECFILMRKQGFIVNSCRKQVHFYNVSVKIANDSQMKYFKTSRFQQFKALPQNVAQLYK